MLFRKLLLLLIVLGSASPVLAQRATVEPLAPAGVPVAVLPSPGAATGNRPPVRPAAPMADQPPRTNRPQPVYLIKSHHSHLIVGSGLGQVNPQDIASIYVYKGADAPAKWHGSATNGIIAITLKPHRQPKFKTTSLAAIRRGLKMRGPVSYQLDGLPLEDLSLRVATADIARLDAQPTASGTVVNIHLAVPPPAVHPPGTIMIRGTTGS